MSPAAEKGQLRGEKSHHATPLPTPMTLQGVANGLRLPNADDPPGGGPASHSDTA